MMWNTNHIFQTKHVISCVFLIGKVNCELTVHGKPPKLTSDCAYILFPSTLSTATTKTWSLGASKTWSTNNSWIGPHWTRRTPKFILKFMRRSWAVSQSFCGATGSEKAHRGSCEVCFCWQLEVWDAVSAPLTLHQLHIYVNSTVNKHPRWLSGCIYLLPTCSSERSLIWLLV